MNLVTLERIIQYGYLPQEGFLPSNRQIDDHLLNLGILGHVSKDPPSSVKRPGLFELTEKGEVFLEMLKETPLPEEKVVLTDPRFKDKMYRKS